MAGLAIDAGVGWEVDAARADPRLEPLEALAPFLALRVAGAEARDIILARAGRARDALLEAGKRILAGRTRAAAPARSVPDLVARAGRAAVGPCDGLLALWARLAPRVGQPGPAPPDLPRAPRASARAPLVCAGCLGGSTGGG